MVEPTIFIDEYKVKLNELLTSKIPRSELKKFTSEMKNMIVNKTGLESTISTLSRLGLDIPESLDIVNLEQDYTFWSEFIFETVGYINEIEKKTKNNNFFSRFVKKFLELIKSLRNTTMVS